MSPRSSPRKVVLVVDDDVAFRRDVCEALEEAGYVGIGAANGRDALEFIMSGRMKPSLILTDLMMPDIDGFEFQKLLAHDRELSRTPVLVVSGAVDVTSLTRLGGRPFLPKPVTPDVLLERVALHCGEAS